VVISIVLIGILFLLIPNEKLRSIISLLPLTNEHVDRGIKIKKELRLKIKTITSEVKLLTFNFTGLPSPESKTKIIINLNEISDDRKKHNKNNEITSSENKLRESESKQSDSLPVPLILLEPRTLNSKKPLSNTKEIKPKSKSQNLVITDTIKPNTMNPTNLAPAPAAVPIEKVFATQLPKKAVSKLDKVIATNFNPNKNIKNTAPNKTIKNNKKIKTKPPPIAPKTGNSAEEHTRGLAYYKGDGVVKNVKTARKWFLKAAEKNHPAAQYNLGIMSYTGQGIKQDFGEAAKWFRLAANQDHALAQYNLGFLYYEGKGLKKDSLQGFMWIDRAANQGDEKAIKALAILEKSLPKDIYKKENTP